jgi:hypothetical protein
MVETTRPRADRRLALEDVLADHAVPEATALHTYERNNVERRLATLASCVHTDDYGTRSAAIIRIKAALVSTPEVMVADGPPCTASFVDHSRSWAAPVPTGS